MGVNIVSEGLVSYSRQSITDGCKIGAGWKMKRKVDRVQQSKSCAWDTMLLAPTTRKETGTNPKKIRQPLHGSLRE
jgi:hypothetical protein